MRNIVATQSSHKSHMSMYCHHVTMRRARASSTERVTE